MWMEWEKWRFGWVGWGGVKPVEKEAFIRWVEVSEPITPQGSIPSRPYVCWGGKGGGGV